MAIRGLGVWQVTTADGEVLQVDTARHLLTTNESAALRLVSVDACEVGIAGAFTVRKRGAALPLFTGQVVTVTRLA